MSMRKPSGLLRDVGLLGLVFWSPSSNDAIRAALPAPSDLLEVVSGDNPMDDGVGRSHLCHALYPPIQYAVFEAHTLQGS